MKNDDCCKMLRMLKGADIDYAEFCYDGVGNVLELANGIKFYFDDDGNLVNIDINELGV